MIPPGAAGERVVAIVGVVAVAVAARELVVVVAAEETDPVIAGVAIERVVVRPDGVGLVAVVPADEVASPSRRSSPRPGH